MLILRQTPNAPIMSTVPGLQATFIKMVDTGRVLGARRGDMDDVGERLGYFRLPDRTL